MLAGRDVENMKCNLWLNCKWREKNPQGGGAHAEKEVSDPMITVTVILPRFG